jgi:hypothetical protein
MKILLMVVIAQSLNLLAFTWFNREAWIPILALRQQLNNCKRKLRKPVLRNRGRLFGRFADHGVLLGFPRAKSERMNI